MTRKLSTIAFATILSISALLPVAQAGMKIPVAKEAEEAAQRAAEAIKLAEKERAKAEAEARADADVYTLYWTNADLRGERIHLATFDAVVKDPKKIWDNRHQCETAATMYRGYQGSVAAIYWCEPGRFHEGAQ
jgi:hypothetical protein